MSFTANWKVLEITVDIIDLGTPEQLYEASGEVYMRLEGSIHGPLKPSEIQEWTKQVFNKVLKTPRMCGLDSLQSFQSFPQKPQVHSNRIETCRSYQWIVLTPLNPFLSNIQDVPMPS